MSVLTSVNTHDNYVILLPILHQMHRPLHRCSGANRDDKIADLTMHVAMHSPQVYMSTFSSSCAELSVNFVCSLHICICVQQYACAHSRTNNTVAAAWRPEDAKNSFDR